MPKIFTDVDGVYSGGMASGVKAGKKKDLSFIFVPQAFSSAGVFTKNQFAAPCVQHSQKCLKSHVVKAIVINAGNANAATGAEGEKNNKLMAQRVAQKLGIKTLEVATASTGIIGVQLPIDRIEAGIDALMTDPYQKSGESTAEAILTTDLFAKTVHREKKIGKKTFVVSGITKGSGMIAPNMATTLSFLVTNAALESPVLQKYLSRAADDSFNMLSVDSDTSTNDMMLIISTGEHRFNVRNKSEADAFQELLTEACIDLAKQIAKDGEGAKRTIEVNVRGAASVPEARQIAKAIVESPLVKTAIAGADPNWGRVIAAAGKVQGVRLNPSKVSLFFGDRQIVKGGTPLPFSRAEFKAFLNIDYVVVTLDLGLGKSTATAWGCDLTEGYIHINTQYS